MMSVDAVELCWTVESVRLFYQTNPGESGVNMDNGTVFTALVEAA